MGPKLNKQNESVNIKIEQYQKCQKLLNVNGRNKIHFKKKKINRASDLWDYSMRSNSFCLGVSEGVGKRVKFKKYSRNTE